jgi:hypothetical protein
MQGRKYKQKIKPILDSYNNLARVIQPSKIGFSLVLYCAATQPRIWKLQSVVGAYEAFYEYCSACYAKAEQ